MIDAGRGKPSQSNLRRAVSTAYYAMFHCLAKSCADDFVGGYGSTRSKHAWRQVYRALEHGVSKKACIKTDIISKFPDEIIDFAAGYVSMQSKRHDADYDPNTKMYKADVLNDVTIVETLITKFQRVSKKDRRAFAAHILFKPRPLTPPG